MAASGTWKRIERAGREPARRPLGRRLFRAGYVAKAAVYAVIGALALALALGAGGRTADPKGALARIAHRPLGHAVVAALAIGLAALALWFFVQAVGDPEGHLRRGAWAVVSRVGQVLGGIGYAWLAFAAVRLALGERAGPAGNAAARSWTARALALPGGRALVLAAAGVVIFVGLHQIWVGVRRGFLEHTEVSRLGRAAPWATALGVVGFVVQGAAFSLVGVFFARAAVSGRPGEAAGFDGALAALAREPWGDVLLAAAAVGLLAYAAFALVEGQHRRMTR